MKFQSSDRSGYQKEPYSLKSKIFTLCAQHSTADYPRFVVENMIWADSNLEHDLVSIRYESLKLLSKINDS